MTETTNEEFTEFQLESALRRTREEYNGTPLAQVAKIMQRVFDTAEIEVLIKYLQP